MHRRRLYRAVDGGDHGLPWVDRGRVEVTVGETNAQFQDNERIFRQLSAPGREPLCGTSWSR
jgi:hypothetical protein